MKGNLMVKTERGDLWRRAAGACAGFVAHHADRENIYNEGARRVNKKVLNVYPFTKHIIITTYTFCACKTA